MILLCACAAVVAYFGTILAAGPAGVLVLRAGLEGAPRRGTWIGFGSAVAQAPYAGLACWGASRFVATHAGLVRTIHGVAGLMLLAVAGWAARKAGADRPAADAGGREGRAFLLGFAATVTNPTPLLSWSMVATSLAAAGVAGGERGPAALAFGACAAVGAAGAHTTLAQAGARLRATGGDGVARGLTYGAAGLLALLGVVALAQAAGG